jgi:hypothetical protein
VRDGYKAAPLPRKRLSPSALRVQMCMAQHL